MLDSSPITIRVAIQRPIHKLLDYVCDANNMPAPGCRVKVNLGNYPITGIVVECDVKSEFTELKPIIEILDHTPLLDKPMLLLLDWASRYYFHPKGEVLFHALPKNLRKGAKPPQLTLWSVKNHESSLLNNNKTHPPTFSHFPVTSTESSTEINSELGVFLEQLKRSPKQTALFQYLWENGESDGIQLQNQCGDNWRTYVNQLIKKDLIIAREIDADYFPKRKTPHLDDHKKTVITHTDEQKHCISEIKKHFNDEQLKPILLHGITGSGKTEVYLNAVTSLLEAGKQILVLVPEIGLTPQLLHRFQQFYRQYSIISLHSALSDGDRTRAWLGAKSGAIQIIIGTRSAVFTPMKNLGAIIVDEEHDGSFKQQEGFLYQGRDMAIKRAFDAKIPVLLGSATPSLETLYNAEQHRYHYLRLDNRPGSSIPPELVLQDIRALPLEAGISNLMLTEIRQHLNNNNQVMLFLNRRGFSPVLMCPSCNWHATCKNCDLGMTYHANAGKIICHHCALETPIGSNCLECNSNKLTTLGQGTERIEAVLASHFPETPVVRIDRDSTSKKGSLENKLNTIAEGKPVILVGTQMLTKGHDFPKLTLVGILDVDQALFSFDYRSQERLAQQVLQVAGRAGRGKDKGRVILQTSQPQHPLLINLLSQGYTETAKQLLNERTLWNYPPVGSQALIRVNAISETIAFDFLQKISIKLRELHINSVELLGPMPSPIAKRANRYRFQLLLSATNRRDLHQFITTGFPLLLAARKTGGVRWNLDIDPIDFI